MAKQNRFQWDVRPLALPENVIQGKCYRFTVLTSNLIRMEYSDVGIFEDRATQSVFYRDFPAVCYKSSLQDDVLTVETDALILKYKVNEVFSADSLSINLKIEPASSWRFGEDFEDLGGTIETLDTVDGARPVERGICSRNGFSVMDDSDRLPLEEDGWIGVRHPDVCDFYFFGYGFNYIGAVQDFYRLTGVPPLLPAYALGNWWSRYYAYKQQEYLDLMDRFKAEDIPFSVGVVDMDWHITKIPEDLKDSNPRFASGWTGYTWNKEYFPDYKTFLKDLHSRNIKTALNLHPAVGTCCHEEQYEQMAIANGIDPATKQRVPLDILSPKHMESYFDILHHPYEEAGVDFWWMDWQQGTNYWWIHEANKPGEYLDPRERLNPLWLLNHLHILDITRDGSKRPMFFSRYAGPGSQRYPVGFSGDTTISWASLNFQPWFTSNASNIGYSWWSHDIGGHMAGERDDELYVRWLQYGVFAPINRLHSSKNLWLQKEPWNYPQPIREIATQWLQFRHKLFPYIYTMNYRNHTQLLPLVQPMYYSHPKCSGAYEVPNQFWFGSELIVAPITEKNDPATLLGRTKAWFPKGHWFDFFTGLHYASRRGRNMNVYRYLADMPVFAKAGAIVPMAKHRPNSNALTNSDQMEVLVFPGASNEFTLYEDSGDGFAYQSGAWAKTEMTLNWGRDAVFTIAPAKGDLSLIPQMRKWKIGLRGFVEGMTVNAFVNGIAVDTETKWDSECNTMWLLIEADTSSEIKVMISGECLICQNADVMDRCSRILGKVQCLHTAKETAWERLTDPKRTLRMRLLSVASYNLGNASFAGAAEELLTLTCDKWTGSELPE